jgi:hypothetical protein
MSKDFICRVGNKRTLFQQVLHNSKNTNQKKKEQERYPINILQSDGGVSYSCVAVKLEDKESSLSTRVTETKILRPLAAFRLKQHKRNDMKE